MRKLSARLIEELGGTEPLRWIYESIREAWAESARLYRRQRLRDGLGLTEHRRDRVNRIFQDLCDRYPGWFPAFDYDRRRSRAFALVERDGLTLTGAITQGRADWIEAAARRLDVSRQTSLLNQPRKQRGEDPLVGLLMIVNGHRVLNSIREYPREIVTRFLVGDRQYSGEEMSLDALFRKRSIVVSRPSIIIPSMKASVTPTSLRGYVMRELISKKRGVRLKDSLIDKPASPPSGPGSA